MNTNDTASEVREFLVTDCYKECLGPLRGLGA